MAPQAPTEPQTYRAAHVALAADPAAHNRGNGVVLIDGKNPAGARAIYNFLRAMSGSDRAPPCPFAARGNAIIMGRGLAMVLQPGEAPSQFDLAADAVARVWPRHAPELSARYNAALEAARAGAAIAKATGAA